MTMDTDRPQPPTRVILEQGGLWGRWGTRLAWIVAGFSFLSAVASAGAFSQYFQRDSRVLEKYHSLAKLATDKVEIVTVAGAIMGGDGFVRAQLDQIEEDPHVKAVVLRVDSPGGTVSGSDELHHRIGKLARQRQLPASVMVWMAAQQALHHSQHGRRRPPSRWGCVACMTRITAGGSSSFPSTTSIWR
jgi:hypothetical protein